MILVARIVNGSQQATSAAGSVIAFAFTLRTVAMLSCNVSETLTINAGADHEKKATTMFRDELVLSLPKGKVGKALAEQIKAVLEDTTTFNVPLTCEVSGPYKNWGEKYQ